MRKCSRVTHVEFPRFEGDDVKGWLFKSEEFFKVNIIPDESKVKFISTHLYVIALKWHKQFLGIMRGQVDWVLYKESILLRFGQNKEFMSDNVKDSSCGLYVIDKVGDLLVNNNHCEVNLGRSECAHKMFNENSIKEILKQDIIAEYSDVYVRESIEVGKNIVEDVVVETAKVNVEVGNEVVDDDKMGDDSEFLVMEVDIFVTDRNRSKLRPHKNNGSFVHRIKDFHLFGMYVLFPR
nr:hypothetical protein [Tanacetum cinerariifolium]